MNLAKIKDVINGLTDILEKNALTNSEYFIMLANLLITFGKSGSQYTQGVNLDDANAVELAYNMDPNNVYLASILQGHILIKWSESFKDE